jgi:hypothetical protein
MTRQLKPALQSFFAAGGLIFFILLGIPAHAQRSSSPPSNTNGPFEDSIERRNRETALRSLKKASRERSSDNSLSPEIVKQINEDFKRVQVIRLGMINDIKANKIFEYKRISEEAAEIKKLAGRLKVSLSLFEPPSDKQTFEKVEFDKDQIQDAVFDLCIEISKFIENPIFKSTGVYKARQAIEAGRALDAIISLSTNISNSAERLRKSEK